MNKKLIIFALILLITPLLAISAYAEESTVTRSFSDNTPDKCSELTISLTVDVNDVDTYYAIDEIVPSNWVISDPGTGDTTQSGHIKWVVTSGAVDTVYQYKVNVPCDALGSYSFNGTYMFEGDTEEQTILGETDVNVEASIDLYEGWNLISIPLNLTNKTVSNIFDEINYSKILGYYDNSWIELNNNSNIKETNGYWIKSLENQTLTIEGIEFNLVNISLKQGWNLISYPSLKESNVSIVFNDINASLVNVLSYENNTWFSYSPMKLDELNTLKTIKPNYGYWVNVGDDVSLVIS